MLVSGYWEKLAYGAGRRERDESTLVKLLSNYMREDAGGQILLDGVDIRGLDRGVLRAYLKRHLPRLLHPTSSRARENIGN